ncbi:AI-2E family transporter [Aerococcus sp. HMSC10H05]|uniref:AI-2E family transporter n=1 Tax=Aerococcus sp. HMSC10H05 TaxID=1581084 RepID=UPI0008A2E27C|nr:AI-2E family transporter [Aerococcus sp. HMSC10H05]OFU51696.1 AI-2E family transporter [Aerococcus sp. HMSC10H05]
MKKKFTWRRIVSLLFVVIVGYWTMNNFNIIKGMIDSVISVTLPFLLGAALAFILNLPLKFFEKYMTKWVGKYYTWYRIVGILFGYVIIIGIIVFIIFLVLPDLQDTLGSFISQVPSEINKLYLAINQYIVDNPQILETVNQLNVNTDQLRDQLFSMVQTFTSGILDTTISMVGNLVSGVFNTFVAIIFGTSILFKKETLARQFKKIIYGTMPKNWGNFTVNLVSEANETFSQYVSGQVVEAGILLGLVFIGMTIFRFPFALSISVLTGAMALIPIYGAIMGGIVGFFLIAVVDVVQAIWFVVFIIVVQQVEGNIIYPRVVGGSVGLPGIWVLFSVTVSGAFFGLAGMLLSVPIFALCYKLASATINYNLEQDNIKVTTKTNNIH